MIPLAAAGAVAPAAGFSPPPIKFGDAGPATATSSISGDVNISQGGLNVPAYPNFNVRGNVSPEFSKPATATLTERLDDLVNGEGDASLIYYYAAAGVALVVLIMKKRGS